MPSAPWCEEEEEEEEEEEVVVVVVRGIDDSLEEGL
jgi:hypothetical protein